jgi:hypothetical protein
MGAQLCRGGQVVVVGGDNSAGQATVYRKIKWRPNARISIKFGL